MSGAGFCRRARPPDADRANSKLRLSSTHFQLRLCSNNNLASAITLGGITMIKLGIFDSEVQPAALNAYLQKVKGQTVQIMGKDKLRGEANDEWVDFEKLPDGEMKVAQAQSFLKQAGFFPFGEIDGV